jgi:hypothetical protein
MAVGALGAGRRWHRPIDNGGKRLRRNEKAAMNSRRAGTLQMQIGKTDEIGYPLAGFDGA